MSLAGSAMASVPTNSAALSYLTGYATSPPTLCSALHCYLGIFALACFESCRTSLPSEADMFIYEVLILRDWLNAFILFC